MYRIQTHNWDSVRIKTIITSLVVLALTTLVFVYGSQDASAACDTSSGEYGKAESQVNIETSGTYTVWTRIWAPDTAVNSYNLSVDDGTDKHCGVVVGNGSANVPAKTWTWVDFKNNQPSSKVTMDLSKGQHKVILKGHEGTGLRIDRLLFLRDDCTPQDDGSNCLVESDTNAPSVSISTPKDNSTVSGSVQISADASDNKSVSSVEFKVDGNTLSTDNSSPYNAQWNTSGYSEANHTVTATATDPSNNQNTDSVTVEVQNTSDQYSCSNSEANVCEDFSISTIGEFNTAPSNGWDIQNQKAVIVSPEKATSGNGNTLVLNPNVKKDFTYTADASVTGSNSAWNDFSVIFNYQDKNNYYFASFNESNDGKTNGIFKVSNGSASELTNFSSTIKADTTYEIKIVKRGNKITVYRNGNQVGTATDRAFSDGKVGIGTRNDKGTFDNLEVTLDSGGIVVPSDKQPPSVPPNFKSSNVSKTSATLKWGESTDNVGVAKYVLYKNDTKMADILTTLYTDNNLKAGTKYNFELTAVDETGNESKPAKLSVTTKTDEPSRDPDAYPTPDPVDDPVPIPLPTPDAGARFLLFLLLLILINAR